MKPFVLLLMVITPNGISTNSTMFADKAACEAALNALASDFAALNTSVFKGQLTFYLHCQAVQATTEEMK